jgi:hypothetical protein
MALPELAVMQQTFELLHQLDPQAQRRVLKWVKAALEEADPASSPAPAELIDAAVQEPAEPGETSVVDEPVAVADLAAEPATTIDAVEDSVEDSVEDEAPAEDRDEAAEPSPETGRRGRRAAKTAVKPARGRKIATPTAEASPVAAAGRRGRPPADEIMRVYQEVDGKLTALAKHYGKPYGTIQGWASILREQGYPIGRSRKS